MHLPDLSDFFLYCLYTRIAKYELGLANRVTKLSGSLGLRLFDVYRSPVLHALEDSKRFDRPGSIQTKAQLAKEFISLGHHTGEGWLITGEMAEMIEKGVSNILCVQPFACLPNHISGKSVFNAIKRNILMQISGSGLRNRSQRSQPNQPHFVDVRQCQKEYEYPVGLSIFQAALPVVAVKLEGHFGRNAVIASGNVSSPFFHHR